MSEKRYLLDSVLGFVGRRPVLYVFIAQMASWYLFVCGRQPELVGACVVTNARPICLTYKACVPSTEKTNDSTRTDQQGEEETSGNVREGKASEPEIKVSEGPASCANLANFAKKYMKDNPTAT